MAKLSTALGLDIGGANLKAAHTNNRALSVPFALWKNPAGLADALRRLLDDMPSADALAVTMTGELCDCFESKRQGVLAILDAVQATADTMPIHVWNNDGHFVDVTAARQSPLQTASANWLALAAFAGRYAPKGQALLLDIGSTTTDIVPLLDGDPVPKRLTDPERLNSSELRYVGVRRTPLCALLGAYAAAEVFATTLDAYLILDYLAEDAADCNTADGRPATKNAAEARMARMLLADLETSTASSRRILALEVQHRQQRIIGDDLMNVARRFSAPVDTVLLSGEGEFLGRIVMNSLKQIGAFAPNRTVSLSDRLGPDISRAACAYAVAVLAAEQG